MRLIVVEALLAVVVAINGAAQVAPKGSGFRAEYLAELSVAEDHLVRLAETIPAGKYAWRPAAGVRSISEVLLHIAGSNFNLPRVIGVAPPEGMVGRDYDKSTTDKSIVVARLRDSFAFLRRGVEQLTDADAEKKGPVVRRREYLSWGSVLHGAPYRRAYGAIDRLCADEWNRATVERTIAWRRNHRSQSPSSLVEGELYSTPNEDGTYSVL